MLYMDLWENFYLIVLTALITFSSKRRYTHIMTNVVNFCPQGIPNYQIACCTTWSKHHLIDILCNHTVRIEFSSTGGWAEHGPAGWQLKPRLCRAAPLQAPSLRRHRRRRRRAAGDDGRWHWRPVVRRPCSRSDTCPGSGPDTVGLRRSAGSRPQPGALSRWVGLQDTGCIHTEPAEHMSVYISMKTNWQGCSSCQQVTARQAAAQNHLTLHVLSALTNLQRHARTSEFSYPRHTPYTGLS